MSVVPYNQNNEVVFHDPKLGVLVLHNNQNKTIQLLSTAPASEIKDLSSSGSHNLPPLECPNCGFLWNLSSPSSTAVPPPNGGRRYPFQRADIVSKRRGSGNDESPHSEDINNSEASQSSKDNEKVYDLNPDVNSVNFSSSMDKFGNQEFSKFHTLPFTTSREIGGFNERFMHHDYFKLLGDLPSTTPSTNSPPHSLKNHYSFTSNNSSLPETIFNQGYFKRFFRKVPPFILGSGAHAQVYKVVHVLNDIKLGTYAVKRICIGDKIEFLQQVLHEVMILYELSIQGANENNLIRYNHVWLELGDIMDSSTFILPGSGSGSMGMSKVPYVFILQQYCAGGHLEDLVCSNFLREERLSMKEKVERERQARRKRRNSRRRSSTKTVASSDQFEDEQEVNDNDSIFFNDDNGINLLAEENEEKKWLDEVEIWKFFKDVANGVHYLHHHGILHRDLKPSNCLLDIQYSSNNIYSSKDNWDFEGYIATLPKVLVTDFGEGKYINKHKKFEVVEETSTSINEMFLDEEENRRGNTGTLEFTAPELWLYSNYDPETEAELDLDAEVEEVRSNGGLMNEFTFESDIYSLGLILCWLCVGTLPFTEHISDDTDPQVIKSKILKWYFNLDRASFASWFSSKQKSGKKTGAMIDFESLIYKMIKGRADQKLSKRLLTGDILPYLENMKWRFERAPADTTTTRGSRKGSVKLNSEAVTPFVFVRQFCRRYHNVVIVSIYLATYLTIELCIFFGFKNVQLLFFTKMILLALILGLDRLVIPSRGVRLSLSAAICSICIALLMKERWTGGEADEMGWD